MQATDERDTKARIADAVSHLLSRYWKPILIGAGVIAVVLIAVFGWMQIQANRAEAAAEMLDEVEQEIESFEEAEEEERAEAAERVLESADDLVEQYPRTYAASRALTFKAEVHWQEERWDEAEQAYLQVAEDHPDKHLAPVALLNAAAAAEAAESTEEALSHVDRLIERYGGGDEPLPEAARALFTKGRLYESLEDYEEAGASYEQLVDRHPESNWTNLARNRIIALTTNGLID
ncbi:MAG: tetratricopeptide repeat protein [Spirochaetaceae bacterium]